MITEARPGLSPSDTRFYQLLVPKSIFGQLSDEEMSRRVNVALAPGHIRSLFDLLDERITHDLSVPIQRRSLRADTLLAASAETVKQMLEACQIQNGLPVNPRIASLYDRLSQSLSRRAKFGINYGPVVSYEVRLKREFDPFIRMLAEGERSKITRVAMKVSQLDLVGAVALDSFEAALGTIVGEGGNQFTRVTHVLDRILTGLRMEGLGLPVNENFVRLTETAVTLGVAGEVRI